MAMPRENWQLYNDEEQQPMWEYKKKYRDKTPLINSDAYYAGANATERRKRLFDFEKEKPATFINKPLNRSQLRKKFMRKVKKTGGGVF